MGDIPAAELIGDDPEWPMPEFVDGRRTWPRRLRVWRLPDQTVLAVVTERGPGPSVTNVAEHAYAALSRLHPGPLRMIEHYPPGATSMGEFFTEVTVVDGLPKWRRLRTPDLVAQVGAGVLDDMPDLPPDPEDHELPPPGPRPPTIAPEDDVTFRGLPADGGGRLVFVEDAGGQTLGLLTHYVRFSVDGFAWGYHGSGPSELARCLLIAVLGPAAACRQCGGTGERSTPSTEPAPAAGDFAPCPGCPDGLAVPDELWEAFTVDVVGRWPIDKPWQLTAGHIRTWLSKQPDRSGSRDS